MKDKAVLVVLVFKSEEKAGEPKINAKGSSESYRTNYDRIFSKAELQRYHNSSKYLMDLLWDDLNYVPEIGVMKT